MSFLIKVKPADFEFSVDDNSVILQQALSQDIDLPFGCQGGACGSCKVKKTSGEITYPDDELPPALEQTEHADGYILCCQAIAKSDLILEIPSISASKRRILTLPVRLLKRQKANDEEVLLTLKLPGAQKLPAFENNQNFEILAGPAHTVAACRCNTGDQDTVVLKVQKSPSDSYTEYLYNGIEVGEMLRIRGPVEGQQ